MLRAGDPKIVRRVFRALLVALGLLALIWTVGLLLWTR